MLGTNNTLPSRATDTGPEAHQMIDMMVITATAPDTSTLCSIRPLIQTNFSWAAFDVRMPYSGMIANICAMMSTGMERLFLVKLCP